MKASARRQALIDYYSVQQIAANCAMTPGFSTHLARVLRAVALALRAEAHLTEEEIRTGIVEEAVPF